MGFSSHTEIKTHIRYRPLAPLYSTIHHTLQSGFWYGSRLIITWYILETIIVMNYFLLGNLDKCAETSKQQSRNRLVSSSVVIHACWLVSIARHDVVENIQSIHDLVRNSVWNAWLSASVTAAWSVHPLALKLITQWSLFCYWWQWNGKISA